jgi:hypothetical protein
VQTNQPTKNPLGNLLIINKSNASKQKPTILDKGPSGTGKTHFWLTAPGPIVAAYTDKNMATVTAAIDDGVPVELVAIDTWSDWEDVFVPAVENRLIEAETIVVDTVDMLAKIMWRELQGTMDKLRIQDFGTGLNRMVNTLTQLCSASVHYEGKRSYNIIVASHITDVTSDSGSLVKTTCAVMGALKDNIEDLFDYVVLADSEIATEIEAGKAVKSKRFFMHTIPPTRYHTTKAPAYFPAEIGNTWPDLQDALALRKSVGEAKQETQSKKEE